MNINFVHQAAGGRRADPPATSGHESGDTMENCSCSNKFGEVQSARIPFFGSADDDTMSTSWSHLNHRVEEYRNDLVKVVEVSKHRISVTLLAEPNVVRILALDYILFVLPGHFTPIGQLNALDYTLHFLPTPADRVWT